MKLYRQGDVLLQKLETTLPLNATPVENKETRLILAYGEVTGHAHALSKSTASMYMWEGERLIEVTQNTQLLHEEHSAVNLEPGVYKVIQQVEYHPQEIRNVAD
jgi:hypothetical protein